MEAASGFANPISSACCNNNKLKVDFCVNASYSSVACFPPRTRIFPSNLRYKVVMPETRSFRLNPRCEGASNAEIGSKKSSLSASELFKTSAADPQSLDTRLKKVRDEFKMHESDCGSSRVQVALLTTRIKHVSSVLQKKDNQSRRGLQAMVQRRKKLLKYLRRTDWDSYCLVLSKLGLRDNPDVKA